VIAFWLHVRAWRGGAASRIAAWTTLVTLAASIHPYLWLMIVVLSAAAVVRYAWNDGVYGRRDALMHIASAAAASGASAWLLGWLTIGGRTELGSVGLGEYSANVLGLIASNGISAFIPSLPVLDAQIYE